MKSSAQHVTTTQTLWVVACTALALWVAACTAEAPADIQSDEDLAEFQQAIEAETAQVDGFVRKTQQGSNLTEFTLGWFVVNLLNQLCSQDQELFSYIHGDDHRSVENYLRNAFQAKPDEEIQGLGELAEHGHSATRLAARDALDALTHIPDTQSSAEAQATARRELRDILLRLKLRLNTVTLQAGSSTR
ncbi:conserved exported hypothetical protein [Candidatus Terasakiella magnetica]|nr:conserved exported hypothetical protein [Candidatus Terasakiella magnetica]